MKTQTIACLAAAFILLLFAWVVSFKQPAVGSVAVSNEYQSTTTAPAATGTGTFTGLQTIKTGQGSLAQVVITGDNTGNLVFYDATTSNVNLRTGRYASSTIVIAEIAASAPEGTYTFDAEFTDGLLVSRVIGAGPTSTIIYR